MSCIKVDITVISAEPSISAKAVVEEPVITVSQDPRTDVVITAVSVTPEVIFTLSSAHASNISVTGIISPVEYVVSLVCSLTPFISCIANGLWINEQPWIDEEGWKN